VLFRWAVGMMDAADTGRGDAAELQAYRDGLLLAMLACRARRLRAMAGLRVGKELVLRGEIYRLELGPDLVKTKRRDHVNLPSALVPYIQRYLVGVRPALLAGRSQDAVWINPKGGKWTAKGIQHRVFKLTTARFGFGFGPHRFRHAASTTSRLRGRGSHGLSAGMLGISVETNEQHYERAGQVQAARMMNALVESRTRAARQYNTSSNS
jgi:site-specific recombinase XerC